MSLVLEFDINVTEESAALCEEHVEVDSIQSIKLREDFTLFFHSKRTKTNKNIAERA